MTTGGSSGDLFGWSAPSSAADRYPLQPGYKGAPGGASADAAKLIAPTVTGKRATILKFIQDNAAQGVDR